MCIFFSYPIPTAHMKHVDHHFFIIYFFFCLKRTFMFAFFLCVHIVFSSISVVVLGLWKNTRDEAGGIKSFIVCRTKLYPFPDLTSISYTYYTWVFCKYFASKLLGIVFLMMIVQLNLSSIFFLECLPLLGVRTFININWKYFYQKAYEKW